MLTMCSGIFVPLSEPDLLRKPAWYEDSLIQSMFPADRQLVGNSSVISPWVYGFFWIGDLLGVWLVLNMHGVGGDTHKGNEGRGWQGNWTVFFLAQALQS